MKWLCALLLAANLLYWGYHSMAGAPGAIRHSTEINADKVKLLASLPVLNVTRPAVASDIAEAAAPAPLPASAPAPTPAPRPTPTPAPKEVAAICMRWSGTGQPQTDAIRGRLKALGLASSETTVSGKVWVYIPPQTDLELAKRKVQQLSDQGVQDFYLINNGGRWQNAISLGVFSNKDGAERRLAELKAQGVRSAVLREREDSPSHTVFALRKVSADQQQKLEKINSQLKGAQLQTSSCP